MIGRIFLLTLTVTIPLTGRNLNDCGLSKYHDCTCEHFKCLNKKTSISTCKHSSINAYYYGVCCCPESYFRATTTIPTTTVLSLSSTATPIAETSSTSSLPLPMSLMKTKPLPQSASLSSTTKHSPSETRRSWKTLKSEYLSSIRALSVEKQDSIQKASNITSILLQDLRKERPDKVNLLVATSELESFAIKYGKIHLTAKKNATVRQDLFEMKIQRVFENNTNPFTCSKSDGTESIIIPLENLKGQDAVTVCTLFDGEIKQWIPDENRIDLNSKTIMNFKLSNIIGSTVDPRPPDDVLQKNVTVIFRYQEGLEAHCVFWDFTAKANFSGSWSSKGCSVVNRNKTEITCACNHLTNFAVLMHVGADNEVPADHKVALKVITYVGCALSLIGELLTVVAYSVFMDLKEDQTQIRFNLVVAIAIAQITFLAGIDATEVKELCVFVAAMIHYFYLVGFAWMLFEGVYLYLMVVKVFNTVIRLYLFYGVAWGVSLLIVVLSIVIASIQDGGIESYVQDHFCWVSFKNNLIWTFVAPVLLVCT